MAERDVVPEPGAPDPAERLGDRTLPRPGASRHARSGGRSWPVPAGGRSPLRTVRRPAVRTTSRRPPGARATPADELREALEQLRRVLELDPPPDRRRRAALLLAGALALAAAGVVALGLLVSGGSVPVAATAARSRPAGPSRPDPAVLPPGFPASGPGIDVPGTRVRATVDRDGAGVDVVETLLLAAPGPGPLALTMPALAGLGPTEVTRLGVELDGTPVAVTVTTRDGVRGWTVTPDGTGTRRAVLRYRISGALVRVAPAPAGRALALVTPLTAAVSQAAGRPVVVDVIDSRVRGVACPGVQEGGSVCGSRTETGWTASVPAGATPVVLLQIDGD